MYCNVCESSDEPVVYINHVSLTVWHAYHGRGSRHIPALFSVLTFELARYLLSSVLPALFSVLNKMIFL
jgi:hypothetical protein